MAGEIRINPAEVDAAGTQFATKRAELEALIQQANTLINNLRGSFIGNRAQAIYSEWDGMATSLKTAVSTLDQASSLLKRASADFQAADSSK
jgi:WXG100 family type VII secretion target